MGEAQGFFLRRDFPITRTEVLKTRKGKFAWQGDPDEQITQWKLPFFLRAHSNRFNLILLTSRKKKKTKTLGEREKYKKRKHFYNKKATFF